MYEIVCDYCRDGLSFMKGEVDTVSLGYPYHAECYRVHIKKGHDEYRKKRRG